MILKSKTIPAGEGIITLTEAKAYMRIATADTSRDTEITSSVMAASLLIEKHTGYRMVQQVWQIIARSWIDNNTIRELPFGSLKYGNLISLDSIKYNDEDGNEQTVSSTLYNVNGVSTVEGEFIFSDDFTYPELEDDKQENITIEYTIGYPVATEDYQANIPEPIKTACKMWIDDIENCTGGIESAKAILDGGYRYWWGQ